MNTCASFNGQNSSPVLQAELQDGLRVGPNKHDAGTEQLIREVAVFAEEPWS